MASAGIAQTKIILGAFTVDEFITAVHYWRMTAGKSNSDNQRSMMVACALNVAFPGTAFSANQVTVMIRHNRISDSSRASDRVHSRPLLPRIVAPMSPAVKCPCGGSWGPIVEQRQKISTLITNDSRQVPCVLFERRCCECDYAYTASFIYKRGTKKHYRTERNLRQYHDHEHIL